MRAEHALPSPDAALSSVLSAADLVATATGESDPAPLPPDRYDFTVGRVDLGDRGSQFVRQVSSAGFSVPVPGSTRRAFARATRRRPPPPGQAQEEARLIAGLKSGNIISRQYEPPPWFTVPKSSGALRFIFKGTAVNDALRLPPSSVTMEFARVRPRHGTAPVLSLTSVTFFTMSR